jgi:hypothetical protein
VIHSCINKASGMIKVVAAKAACPRGSYAQELATPEATTPPPASTLGVEYVTGTTVPNTSVSRALCPPGTLVAGGGGITVQGAEHALQQSFPISDSTGVIAWGSTAIGWQVAADDWSDTQAFVVCLRP